MIFRRFLLLPALFPLLPGCSPSGVETLTVTGSSTLAPLMLEIGRRFEAEHPGIRVNIQTGGSSRGIADVRRGLAHAGMVSRALKPEESDLTAHPIARDGIALIVHSSNPVTELSEDAVRSVYEGRIRNWKALGGPDAPVVVVHKAEGRATLELFLAYFGLENHRVHADVVIGDNEQGVKTVAGNPHALGYVSIGTAETAVARGVPIRLLPLSGVGASTAAVRDGSYPLSRTLVLVTKGEPEGAVRDLVRFARSEAVRDLVEALAFVPY